MKYEPIIGLEVHVELKTATKMFCRCSADYFGKEPNTHTCPVCLGLPGALPFINQQAIDDCMRIGLALNCQVASSSRFERKNYFYPDLSKGYQISQYRWPLCINGWLEVMGIDGQLAKIRINRVHQEEDTGKLTHEGDQTLVDFNRSGVPLVEIVTEPDFTSSEQVKNFAKTLQQVFRKLGVSNADMEKGDMRLEANVSVRKVYPLQTVIPAKAGIHGSRIKSGMTEEDNAHNNKELPNYRIELKNINSFRFMAAAIEYEIIRQSEALEKGEKLTQETRGWNEAKKETYLQRGKEEAHDYRYFPDPDLPELRIEELRIKNLELSLPEMPWEAEKRLEETHQLSKIAAVSLVNKDLVELFEDTLKEAKDVEVKTIANYLINTKTDPTLLSPEQIINEILSKKAMVVDTDEISKWVDEVIIENPQMVTSYKAGKVTVLQALIGSVMKKSQGKAQAGVVKKVLEQKLA